jgi:hypothetical protein
MIGSLCRGYWEHVIVFPAQAREVLPGLLSRIQNASLAGEGQSGTAFHASINTWTSDCGFRNLEVFTTGTGVARLNLTIHHDCSTRLSKPDAESCVHFHRYRFEDSRHALSPIVAIHQNSSNAFEDGTLAKGL